MLFFKPKLKPGKVLPLPPSPILELKEAKAGYLEEKEFDELVKEFGEAKQKNLMGKKRKGMKKASTAKKEKIHKKVQKKLKKKPFKLAKRKKLAFKKIKKGAKKQKAKFPELEEGLELEGLDFKLPKELKLSKKEIKLPETLEEFDIEDFGKQLYQETKKPKEILEAEEEIKGAIEKIKKQEKPSFLKRLFAKKEGIKEKPAEEKAMPELTEGDNASIIQNRISEARQALANFDLETARKNYIGIMEIYNRMKPEEQGKVYQDIRDLYFERKSAEELKV